MRQLEDWKNFAKDEEIHSLQRALDAMRGAHLQGGMGSAEATEATEATEDEVRALRREVEALRRHTSTQCKDNAKDAEIGALRREIDSVRKQLKQMQRAQPLVGSSGGEGGKEGTAGIAQGIAEEEDDVKKAAQVTVPYGE